MATNTWKTIVAVGALCAARAAVAATATYYDVQPGVIVGPDRAAWVTDGGQNAIVRVDPATRQVKAWKLPADSGYTNLNTATFDQKGRVWFTGQSGIYGRLDPATGDVKVWKAP